LANSISFPSRRAFPCFALSASLFSFLLAARDFFASLLLVPLLLVDDPVELREIEILELRLLADRRGELFHEVLHEVRDEDGVLDVGGVLLLRELVGHLLREGGELDLLSRDAD
jgi:hypothetical protein